MSTNLTTQICNNCNPTWRSLIAGWVVCGFHLFSDPVGHIVVRVVPVDGSFQEQPDAGKLGQPVA